MASDGGVLAVWIWTVQVLKVWTLGVLGARAPLSGWRAPSRAVLRLAGAVAFESGILDCEMPWRTKLGSRNWYLELAIARHSRGFVELRGGKHTTSNPGRQHSCSLLVVVEGAPSVKPKMATAGSSQRMLAGFRPSTKAVGRLLLRSARNTLMVVEAVEHGGSNGRVGGASVHVRTVGGCSMAPGSGVVAARTRVVASMVTGSHDDSTPAGPGEHIGDSNILGSP